MDRPQDINQQDDLHNGNKIDEKRFVKDALVGGLTEVELGKLAVQKASSDAVRQFAQKMIDDHSKANDELRTIAAKENITVPDSLDSKRQSKVDKLAKLSGADFDRAYIKDALKDQDVQSFQQEAKSGSDPDVKSFASKTLPTLEDHLTTAKGSK
jgi:putative membrane protein